MADNNGAENEQAAKPGGGRKFLVIGLVLGLLIGGAGAGGYFLFMGGEEENANTPATAEQAVPEKETKPIKTAFVKLDRLSAPLVSNGRVVGYVLLDLSLEVIGSENEVRVAQRLPALKASFLREVTTTPIGKPDQPMIIDYESLTARLTEVANRELDEELILRVLVTQSTRV